MRDNEPIKREELTRLVRSCGLQTSIKNIDEFIDGLAAAASPSLPSHSKHLESLSLITGNQELSQLILSLVEERAEQFDSQLIGNLSNERTTALRKELGLRGLDGFVAPLADEHNNEFIPKRAQRLAWLTGFTGSAGIALVLMDKAAIFIDGRYTLQADEEIDRDIFTPHHLSKDPYTHWITKHLNKGECLGYDPWLHTEDQIKQLDKACRKAGGTLIDVDSNPIDAVWSDQPPPPIAAISPLDISYTGESSCSKRQRIANALSQEGSQACIITAPDSLAWLLNIRGRDVPCTPLPLGFAILHVDASVDLFIDSRKFSLGLTEHLGKSVRQHAPAGLAAALAELGTQGRKVQLDPATASVWIFQQLRKSGAIIHRDMDPCILPKACKNDVELAGIRAAHVRDGVALTCFLNWLAVTVPNRRIDELTASATLAAFRANNQHIQSLSFETIAGSGPNGAIVHYRVNEKTNRHLQEGDLFLLDSGAQYLDGTTDVTRTIAIGRPNVEVRDRFTRVLKGHIALAKARFPEGTTGSQLDTLARTPLWEVGLDFDHGTGHGVGHYLGVHEGPQRISKVPNKIALKPGMIVSNEPGYYKVGSYGIRIENLVAVIELEPSKYSEHKLLGFETLTRAPLDRNLINTSLMTNEEIDWLDGYHAQVWASLSSLVNEDTAAWLRLATQPILNG